LSFVIAAHFFIIAFFNFDINMG